MPNNENDPPLLSKAEFFWIKMQPLLLKRGYRLRPRYDPNWVPSWLQPQPEGTFLPRWECEDSIRGNAHILDAVRIQDGQKVVFKIVETKTEELPIACMLSSESKSRDKRNCSVPILDVILIPEDDDHALIAMPQLLVFDRLPFRHVGELCEAALQLFDVLHKFYLRVPLMTLFRDICLANIAMDVTRIIPNGYHFCRWPMRDGIHHGIEWNTRWSVRPNQYHIIDYGLSRRCASKSAMVLGVQGQDRTLPEMSWTVPYDPFKADRYIGLEAFADLVDKMTVKDPDLRPTSAEAAKLCRDLVARLESSKKLKKRVWKTYDGKKPDIPVLYQYAMILFGWNPLE
ncbi:hypothetical protein CPC08DRAFT_709316 [Agrocybe pediades]|nr:hypothetical protein CPC08DRAFT_709316 [Agrocybe pediades]